MAYRRRHGISRSATFKEEIDHSSPAAAAAAVAGDNDFKTKTLTSSYSFSKTSKGFNTFEDSRNDSKGFWGVLARKAKAILEDDDDFSQAQQIETPAGVGSWHISDASKTSQQNQQPSEVFRRIDNPRIRRGLNKLNSSLNHIGDTFEKAFEEGRTIVEGKTQEIIQETRNLKIRRKGSSPVAENQVAGFNSTLQQPTQLQNQTNHETQLKASRDVAMATAAKAKLLLRELKTVKADLAFAKERCAQLEEENKILRECREKGDNPADDDLIRVQLESLLAEKARLAHENSVYARENRFLREIVEYHQLSMQDVVYLDEGAEEVTEIGYPINFPYSKMLCESPPSSSEVVEVSPSSFPCTSTKEEILHVTSPKQEANDASNSNSPSPTSPTSLPPHHGRETQDARTTPPLSSVQI
ncbi:hypothetical protein ES288_A03G109900v1 [Gossypium darwinii]|uniref:Uncharacterized protein n=1 Tax=Gossypium darwinii TaxID=34276 RepID=A0A5D2H5C3_GOSDA|nr:hypothetical protein ES288_A03G109900v1 [Gossypium darwinii]